MKSGRELAALRPRFAGGLPSGAFPGSCFLAAFAGSFALGSGAGAVALVALAGFELGFGTLPPIRGQGSADIVGFNERRATLVAAHIPFIGPFIGAGIDQLSLPCYQGHPPALHEWHQLQAKKGRRNYTDVSRRIGCAVTGQYLLQDIGRS
jgi:hypothetical protein